MNQRPRSRRPLGQAEATLFALEQARERFAPRTSRGVVRTAARRVLAILTAADHPRRPEPITRRQFATRDR